MVDIGIRVLWRHFCYTFGSKIYHYLIGGPIGARITMAASRLRMQEWEEKYTMVLINASIFKTNQLC